MGLGWGWSIVGLTVIVRLAILPLTIKSDQVMNAMRALQPQIKQIQEKYKGDRQKMNAGDDALLQGEQGQPVRLLPAAAAAAAGLLGAVTSC